MTTDFKDIKRKTREYYKLIYDNLIPHEINQFIKRHKLPS